ncbi:DNA-binding protein [Frateuria terrea]|uniref:Replication region DNA-binding N-term n=1 Tax=Frateuria terrea TaxID=529704 RepID=A0A1H6UAY1_9GAMM|nr:DNA-binding protein [Frateuria terrea]SEI89528.1 replication region DNA-binding N-term [Frateuria terrea]SFP37105.1 replication region DNA-binding N-term [Frateuria terrea]
MPKGITQDQVNAAADALVAAGEKPTVERVRQYLGTGSPNTVTRMLEAWRGTLAQRLKEVLTLPEVPAEVGEAAVALWRVALAHAETHAQAGWTQAHADLTAAREALAQERAAWDAQLQAAAAELAQARAARDLAEHACATLDAQLQDSHAMRADLVQQRDRLQAACDAQASEIKALRTQLDEHQVSLQAERARQEAYVRGVEDHAHQEIDRARQDAKHWRQQYETSDHSHRDAVAALQTQRDGLREQLRQVEQDLAGYIGQVTALEKALTKARTAARPAIAGRRKAATDAKARPGRSKPRTR